MHLIPALRRQMQADLCEFEASLVYRASSRTVRAVTQRNSVSKKQKVFSCLSVYAPYASTCGRQKRMSHLLGLELQVAVSHLMWVLYKSNECS